MRARVFILTTSATLLSMLGTAQIGPAVARDTGRPNVVILLADDLGYSDLGSYGGESATPNLDRLAAGGVSFTQFYVNPRCSPTRASLLSGLYPHEVGVGHLNRRWRRRGYRGELDPEVPILPEILRRRGYRTYMAGKWHLAHNPSGDDGPRPPGWPVQRGFDRFWGTLRGSGSYFSPSSLADGNELVGEVVDPGFYYTDAIADHAAEFVDDHFREKAEAPFFLLVSFTAPHWPLHAPADGVEALRGLYAAGWEATRQSRFARQIALGVLEPDTALPRFEEALGRRVSAWDESPEWQQRRMEVYAAMVRCLDEAAGKVFEALRRNGAWENSLILFLSDNGASAERFSGIYRLARWLMPVPKRSAENRPLRFGDRPGVEPGPAETFQTYGPEWASVSNTPFRGAKMSTLEGGIAVPLILHWPAAGGVTPGSVIRRPAHVIDLLPTIVEATATDRRPDESRPVPGRSLLPLVRREAWDERPLFWEHQGNRAVRSGRWKLVAGWLGRWQLYDMVDDRTETHDLAADMPQRVDELAALYDTWAQRVGVEAWPWVVPQVRWLVWALVVATASAIAWRRGRRRRSPIHDSRRSKR